MNKKLLALVGVAALGLGAVGAIALQSHAQITPSQSTTTNAPAVVTPPQQENTATDTDNVQNDKGGVEKPDTAVSQDSDKETNDNQDSTSTVKQGDTKEQGESAMVNPNEVEDGN